jgi:hypothetical protein
MVEAPASDLRRRLGLVPGHYGGAIADLLLLATNLIFLTPVAGWFESLVAGAIGADDPVAAQRLAYWLVAAVVLQAIGAYLKRRPLHARLARLKPAPMGCASTWLLIFNYMLSLLILITIVALLPWATAAQPWSSIAVIFVAMVPTYLVYKAMSPPRRPEPPSPLSSSRVEWVADLLLLTYVITNTLFFNVLTGYRAAPPASFGDLVTHLLGLFVVLFIVLIWYLPPRLLFLVEDFQDRATWIRIGVALSPVAFRWVIG